MPKFFHSSAGQRLQLTWRQRSRLLTITAGLGAAEGLLLLLRLGERAIRPQTAGHTLALDLAGTAFAFCLLLLGLRWFRQVVMWRLRNRLVVTYVFIGVIPVVLLILIGIIAGYLLAGQFATFVISSDLTAQLRSLEAINRTAARGIAAQLARGAPLHEAAGAILLESPPRSLTAWLVSPTAPATVLVLPADSPVVAPPPSLQTKNLSAIVGDENGVYLRAWSTVPAGSRQLIAITSEPLDRARLARIAAGIGEVTIHLPSFLSSPTPPAAGPQSGSAGNGKAADPRTPVVPKAHSQRGTGSLATTENQTMRLRAPASGEVVEVGPAIIAGRLTPPRGRLDGEVQFAMPFAIIGWQSGRSTTAIVSVHTRLSSLNDRMFAALGIYQLDLYCPGNHRLFLRPD